MILADTSVWVDHLRRGNTTLAARLETEQIACHPFIVGELACGTLRRRREILRLLERLPMLSTVEHGEALALVEARRLGGRGLGWVDVHLLASVLVEAAQLWTLDRRLAACALALGVSH